MAKKILLIENDQDLVGRLGASLESAGFEVRSTGDGKEGLDLARDWSPQAVILCVELPGMSGYLVCQKLKKDETLKTIPLVLTSAEATEETFEKHRTLKARADEYLLKPYEPAALIAKLGALIGLPEAPAGAGAPAAEEIAEEVEVEEELVSLEEELGMGAAEGEPAAEVAGLELESLPDEPTARAAAEDEDLRLLDDAFNGISAPPAGAEEAGAALDELTGERPVAGDEVDAAAASLAEEDEAAGRAALGTIEVEADAALGALDGVDETLSPGLRLRPEPPAAAVEATARPPVRGASADLLRAAGITLLEEPPAPPPERGPVLVPPPPEHVLEARRGGDGTEAARLAAELEQSRTALERIRDDLSARDDELRDLRRKLETAGRRGDDAEAALGEARSRAEAVQERARKAEAEAKAGKDEARRVGEELADSKRRAAELDRRAAELDRRVAELDRRAADAEKRGADAEKRVEELEARAAAAEEDARRKGEEAAAAADALTRAEAFEREAEGLRTELLVARGEAEGARGEVEKRTTDLKKRISELEAQNAKNEERVVKAYQKIKADEKVRDKVRKALAIASQLLEEGAPAEAEKRPASPPVPAREERP